MRASRTTDTQRSSAAEPRSGQAGPLASLVPQAPTVQRLAALQRLAATRILQRVEETSPSLPEYAEGETPGWGKDTGVPEWAAKEYRGEGVDMSGSPFLPDYSEDETPGWAKDTGVPEWARDEFLARSVIASMDSTGKIGSIYFDDGDRIRTVHDSGPEQSDHTGLTRKQFNISKSGACAAFEASPGFIALDNARQIAWAAAQRIADPAARTAALDKTKKEYGQRYAARRKAFIKAALRDATPDNSPAWATPVTSPETAIDTVTVGLPDTDTQLYEVFLDGGGNIAVSHPSRGAAVRLDTDLATVNALREAVAMVQTAFPGNIKDLKGQAKVDEAYRRNRMFHDHLSQKAPELAAKLRTPEDVRGY